MHKLYKQSTNVVAAFLPARKRDTCYVNVAGWLAGWLAGWVGGWLSVTAGIVSKRLNLS